MLLQIRLDRLDVFHSHVWRIAYNDVEAAAFENPRESGAPVKRVASKGGVLDKAVAYADRRLQILQSVVAPGGLQPKRQASDLDQFEIQVNSVQVLTQDFVERIDLRRSAELVEPLEHRPVFLRQSVESSNQKGP